MQTVRGTWWLPGNEDHTFAGALTISEAGKGSLRSDATVGEEWFSGLASDGEDFYEAEAIQGMSEGRRYTLLKCSMFLPVLGKTKLQTESIGVLQGDWVTSLDEEVYSQALLEIDNLGHFADNLDLFALGDYPNPDKADGVAVPVLLHQGANPITAEADSMTLKICDRIGAGVDHNAKRASTPSVSTSTLT